MDYALFLVAALATLFRGHVEAICFVKPLDYMHRTIKLNEWQNASDTIKQFDLGPRGHVWHKWHHNIGGAFFMFALALGGLLDETGLIPWAYSLSIGASLFIAIKSKPLALALLFVDACALCWLHRGGLLPAAVQIGTVAVIAWEFNELGYSYGRYGTATPQVGTEHVVPIDGIEASVPSTTIHLLRAAAIIGGLVWTIVV